MTEEMIKRIYNLGYEDGEFDGYHSTIIEGGYEESHYGRGLEGFDNLAITEQDIVKPYLNKIKSYTDHLRNCGMGKSKSLDFMDKFLDNLLSEQGDTDDNTNN